MSLTRATLCYKYITEINRKYGCAAYEGLFKLYAASRDAAYSLNKTTQGMPC